MTPTLLYHDVVAHGREDESGFTGPGAARYKLAPDEFRAHLDALAGPCLLTFDDGGASALDPIAGLLEARGRRGLFFITTDCIGRPGFLDAAQLRELRRRGHTLGSHSCSHPERISSCPRDRVLDEWRRSREALSDVLGEDVTTASVPGGFYSRAVAEAAAEAGLTTLYTSEPTCRAWEVAGCRVLGRFTVYRGMSPTRAAALASGRRLARWRQAAWWQVKKLAKAAGGRLYLRLRERALARACPVGQPEGGRPCSPR
jgi:hypothetical protein